MSIREMRLARGWTQQELADRAGIDRATLVRYERGHVPKWVETLGAIAKALDTTYEQLLSEEFGG